MTDFNEKGLTGLAVDSHISLEVSWDDPAGSGIRRGRMPYGAKAGTGGEGGEGPEGGPGAGNPGGGGAGSGPVWGGPYVYFYCFANDCYFVGFANSVPFFCTFTCESVLPGISTLGKIAAGASVAAVCNVVTVNISEEVDTGSLGFSVAGTLDGVTLTQEQGGTALIISACARVPCMNLDNTLPTTIGYTTQQMWVGGTQTLTVVNGHPSGKYKWSTTSGTVSPEEGILTLYTAPATNVNCVSNPTITLMDDSHVCDKLTIAVTTVTYGWALAKCCSIYEGYGYKCLNFAECDGVFDWSATEQICINKGCDSTSGTFGYNLCSDPPEGISDIRTAEMMAAGCCPYQLV